MKRNKFLEGIRKKISPSTREKVIKSANETINKNSEKDSENPKCICKDLIETQSIGWCPSRKTDYI